MESRPPPRWLPRQPRPARDVPPYESYWRRLWPDWWDSSTRGWLVLAHAFFDASCGATTGALAASMTDISLLVGALLGLAGAVGGFVVLMAVSLVFHAVRTPFRQRDEARARAPSASRGLSIEIDDVQQIPVGDDGAQIWKLQLRVINRHNEPEVVVRAWMEIEEPGGTRQLWSVPVDGKPSDAPIRLEAKDAKSVELAFYMGPRTGREQSLSFVAVDASGRRMKETITSGGIPEKLMWMGTVYLPSE